MDDYNIVIRPLITEQGTHLAAVKSAYSFQVNKRANKTQIKNAIDFRKRERAAAFERYLKTGSGRAFLRRHL